MSEGGGMFENVTYTHYSNDLGRAIVPDVATFNSLALENRLYVKSLLDDGLLKEKAAGGIDDAVCLCIEETYKAQQAAAGADNVDTSESIGGYSHSMSAKAAELAVEKNAKSLAENRYKWLSLYCWITNGRKCH